MHCHHALLPVGYHSAVRCHSQCTSAAYGQTIEIYKQRVEYYGVTSSPLAIFFSGVGFPHVVHYALSNLRLQRLTTLHQKYCGYLHLSAISFSEIYMYILLFSKKSSLRMFITLFKNLLTDFTDCCCFHHAILGVLKPMAGLVNMVTVIAARVVAANEHFTSFSCI